MESKKGVLWKILKWIGRVVFAIFILALVYFQAPIKVITFFLIFLLAGIFLKKPYYKYFWLMVLAVVIGLTVWVFLPEDDNGWKPFAFEKDIQALNDKYAVPDNENAALVYNEIFADINDKDLDPNISNDVDLDTMDNPWTAEQYPQLAQWIKDKAPLIAKLKQAAEKEKCFFEIDPNSLLGLENLNSFRRFTHLMIRKANNNLANGDIDAAINDLSIPIQIASHLYQYPVAVKCIVAIAIDSTVRATLKEILVEQKLTNEQYNKITVLLGKNKFSWDDSFDRIHEYEKLRVKRMLPMIVYETKDGKYRFTRNPSKVIMMLSTGNYCPDFKQSYWRTKAVKAATVFEWFIIPTTPDSLVNRIDTIFDEYSISRKMPEYKFNLRYVDTITMVAISNFKAYEKISLLSNKHQDGRNGSLLVLEISKFKNKNGNWPQSLNELDTAGIPLERFIYKPIDETNFILYSIGDNGIDDGGKGQSCRERKCKTSDDDLLIWPRTQAQLDKLTGNATPPSEEPGMGMPGASN